MHSSKLGFLEEDDARPTVAYQAGAADQVILPGGVPLELVYCPAGSFIMGSPASESFRSDNETQHRVTLTKGFWMGKYPVTQKQWQSVVGNNPSGHECDDHPVENVSWDDCQTFCQKLNEMLKGEIGNLKLGAHSGEFRLPTEAQWEYACRAGTATPFCYGDWLDSSLANFDGNYPYGGTLKDVYRKQTTPVGSFQPNAWGLYDMHGNVWEWCSDGYGAYSEGAAVDPGGAASGRSRVCRGGSWCSYAQCCRSVVRRCRPAGAWRIVIVSGD